jgi:Protein of unknown function (DUF2628)
MNTYTLHLPRDAFPHDEDVLEEADLVKDGFSWGAFLFTFLWFFWHRLWLAGLGVLAAVVALNVALALLGMRFLPAFTADLLLMLLIGLEASSLRRWTLERQGRPAVDAVVAADRDEAEMKSFRRWVARGAGPAPSAPPPAAPRRGSDAVIGLFPEAERSR